MMTTVKTVADYFLSLVDEEAGDALTNLKLQKLCYYAQGFHLALEGSPLFDEPIEAWTHGPVVPALYHQLKAYGAEAIPLPTEFDVEQLTKTEQELLNEVYDVFGQYSAWKLRNMTHDEPTWTEAYAKAPGMEITHAAMQTFFRSRLN